MTCIVGVERNGVVYMGGDSSSTAGVEQTETRLRKVFMLGDMLIGYTSSFRMGQILQYHLEVPIHARKVRDDMHYLVAEFIPSVRMALREHGFTKVEANREEGGFFLLGYKGRLYNVQSDFQVNSNALGYDAVGAGASYALGALSVLEEEEPIRLLEKALDAAYKNTNIVKPPYYFASK